jgi:hypothetical protein
VALLEKKEFAEFGMLCMLAPDCPAASSLGTHGLDLVVPRFCGITGAVLPWNAAGIPDRRLATLFRTCVTMSVPAATAAAAAELALFRWSWLGVAATQTSPFGIEETFEPGGRRGLYEAN